MIPIPVSAGTIKAIGFALAVGAMLAMGFWSGYRWQAGNVAKAEQKASQARTERDRWQSNAQSYQVAIASQKAANEVAMKAAEEQQDRADQATAAAKAERDRYEKKLAQITAGVEKDKLDPKCKAELERPVCGSPWQ